MDQPFLSSDRITRAERLGMLPAFPKPAVPPGGAEAPADIHRHIVALMQTVRRADCIDSRAAAFEECKQRLRIHDMSEPSIAAPHNLDRSAPRSSMSDDDRSIVLARVIVRELDEWPQTDPGWMQRFTHLETAFHMHVAIHERPAAPARRPSFSGRR